MRHDEVDLADVDVIAAIVAPQVVGTPTVRVDADGDDGSWNTKGLAYAYQWLRDGKTVAGRTAATYKIGSSDIGTDCRCG